MKREDALEYLPIIKAYGEGKTIQFKGTAESSWVDNLSGEPLSFMNPPDHYRIKPEPEIKYWNKSEHVPGPVCWIRLPGGDAMILGTSDSGVQYAGIDKIITLAWKSLKHVPYSTDRKTWLPCIVSEETAS